jgi:BirA family transcriptional regulator, biotin operon repressor / biotin---[acetyl-CoA-carboxylase] ligase
MQFEFEIKRFQIVESTMDVARRLADDGAPEGIAVVADEQTAGRGRSAHTWYSPPGQSLYVSLLLRPPLAPAEVGWITMIAALAVRDSLLEIGDWKHPSGFQPQEEISNLQSPISIKWFNDVLLNRRKVCGILLETSLTGEQVDYGILGIGLNVNTRFDDATADVRARATSLFHETGHAFERDAVLTVLLTRFGERYAQLLRARQSPAAEYAQHVETVGHDVRIDTGREIIAGRALRIEDDGALIVLTPGGERRAGFGDVMG